MCAMQLGFISDIHEDITSLQKALRLLEREKVDSIICLGGYCWICFTIL